MVHISLQLMAVVSVLLFNTLPCLFVFFLSLGEKNCKSLANNLTKYYQEEPHNDGSCS